MKTNILLLLILIPFAGVSQSDIFWYYFTFEDSTHEYFMYRDTVSNPNSTWQIGEPQKTVFNSAFNGQNAVVTDTLNPYPINDTSSFIIKHEVGLGWLFLNDLPVIHISGEYFCNTDTLNDYGKIEFSPDNGLSWILISDDTTTLQNSGSQWPYISYSPIFTGNSNGWQIFNISLSEYDLSTFNVGDSVQYKFTFISDGTADNLDGLMFDNITINDDQAEGLEETITSRYSSFPNPFSNQLTFKINDNLTALTIYDINGKIVYTSIFQNQSQIEIETSAFKNGVYFYVFSDKNGGYTQRGKVVKI